MFNKPLEAKIDGNGNVIIQDTDNSTITINMNNPEEVSKALVNLNDRLSQLPLKIIKFMEEKRCKELPTIGANVYISCYIMVQNNCLNVQKCKCIGITITSTTKDIRYFNEPFFKLSSPLDEKRLDTFFMTKKIAEVQFPHRLEYGQPVSVHYILSANDLFQKILNKDPNATIVGVVTTTLGETYYSNKCEIRKFIHE